MKVFSVITVAVWLMVWGMVSQVQALRLPIIEVEGEEPMEAVPGVVVGRGYRNEPAGGAHALGGSDSPCVYPHVSVTTGADTYMNGRLHLDESTCEILTGEVWDEREHDPRFDPDEASEVQGEGGAASYLFEQCDRYIMNRTSVYWQPLLYQRVYIRDPLYFLLNWRVSRVYQSFRIKDDGRPAPHICYAFDNYASSLETLGFYRDAINSFVYQDPNGMDRGNGECVNHRAQAFLFDGHPLLINMPAGYHHALEALCTQKERGFYQCKHDFEGSVPNGWYQTPVAVPYPFFTDLDYEGTIIWESGCPREWIKLPQMWR